MSDARDRGGPQPSHQGEAAGWVPPEVPPADENSAAYWAATGEHRLTVQSCAACRHVQHPPRAVCTGCSSMEHLGQVDVAGTGLASTSWPLEVTPERPVMAGRFEARFDGAPPDLFLLDLTLADTSGAIRATGRYLFAGGPNLAPLLDLAPAQLDVTVAREDERWTLRLDHRGGPAAIGVTLEDDRPIGDPGWAEVEDSGFDLLPMERAEIAVTWRGAPIAGRRVRVSGWNAEAVVLE